MIRDLPDEPLLDSKEAAAKLNMSVKMLMGHVYAGRIRYIDIGSGGKRKTYRFTPYMLQVFIDNQLKRETPKCLSTKALKAHSTVTTSNSTVVAFSAVPKPATRKTPGLSNAI
jgi:hypothetical protein